jgi:hypothetical protein
MRFSKPTTWVPVLAVVCLTAVHAQSTASWVDAYRSDAMRLIELATRDDFAWQRVATLTDTFGNRLSASDNMARAVAWTIETMKADGLENVRAERVMVPNWIRGAESAEILEPARHPVVALGLGGTVATPPGGLEAEVVPVTSFADLTARTAEVKGRIVLFDVAYSTYAETDRRGTRCGRSRGRGRPGALGGPHGAADGAHRRRDLCAGPLGHPGALCSRRGREPHRTPVEGGPPRADAAGDERVCRSCGGVRQRRRRARGARAAS